MKQGIHPNYGLATITCACGNSFQTRSVQPKYHVEICSACHPFFTGKQKLVDSAGRMERFAKRFEKTQGKTVKVKAKGKEAKSGAAMSKVLTTSARKAQPQKKAPEKTK